MPVSPSTQAGDRPLLIGTRGSALALWQATSVQGRLHQRADALLPELRVVNSDGDRDKRSPLAAIGGRGVFASALQDALRAGEIDAAVHSAKDLPGETPAGLVIAAFPERDDPHDAIVSRHGVGLAELPRDPVVGTSSKRRAVQIRALRPDARIVELRGNIDTRLRKSAGDDYDAIVIAAAGLIRMGWEDRITQFLPVESFTPAPGQGVLAVETRVAPDPAAAIVARLDDARVRTAIEIERAFLRGLGGGCTSPIGAFARLENERIEFFGMVASDDGTRIERVHEWLMREDAPDRVHDLARQMLAAIGKTVAPVDVDIAERLHDVRVVLTGTPAVTDGQAAQLEAEGAVPIPFPTVRIEPAPDQRALATAVDAAIGGDYDWLAVTSANAVAPLAERLAGTRPLAVRVAAVGERTAEALSNAGIAADLVAAGNGAHGLLDAFATHDLRGKRILALLSDRAGPGLADGLRARGAVVDVVIAYRTLAVDRVDPVLFESLTNRPPDAVFLTSPSAVESLVALLGADLGPLAGADLIAIGESTATAIRAAGLPVATVAASPDPAGMIAALRNVQRPRRIAH